MFRAPLSHRLLALLLLVAVFVLAVHNVADTDTWVHFSLGRAIWQLKGWPATEQYVFTALERPLYYTSWLFGVFYYLVFTWLGAYGVILLRAATVVLAFYVLLLDATPERRNTALAVAVLMAIAIICRIRFVDRPDAALMLLLPLSIYGLNHYVRHGGRRVWLLVPLHLLWASVHSSVILMFIPFGVVIGAGGVQRLLAARGMRFEMTPSWAQLRTLGLVFAASFVATLINPNGVGQYTYGPSVMDAAVYTEQIGELAPPTWEGMKAPFVLPALLFVVFVGRWTLAVRRRRNDGTGELPAVAPLLLVLPFIYAALTSMRFVIILAVVAGPVLVREGAALMPRQLPDGPWRRWPMAVGVALWIVVATVSSLAAVPLFAAGDYRLGFGVDLRPVPEAAMAYLDSRGVEGRVFNTFHWGGYIAWRDFPRRSVFVDPRGYVAPDLLEKMHSARAEASIMAELQATYGFEAIVVNYPIGAGNFADLDADQALSSDAWALVYWDDSALVYLRRDGPYRAVIEQDAYRAVIPANGVAPLRAKLHDDAFRVAALAELQRNIAATGSARAAALVGYMHSERGEHDAAIAAFEGALRACADDCAAFIYNGLAVAHTNRGELARAIAHYERALQRQPDAPTSYNIGLTYLRLNDVAAARRYLEQALDLDATFTPVYAQLIAVYRRLDMQAQADALAQRQGGVQAIVEGRRFFEQGVAAYLDKRYDLAIAAFDRSLAANPNNPAPHNNLGYLYYDLDNMQAAFAHQQRALQIDPTWANAHYGVALLYKERGNRAGAQQHWREYLRLEPKGYFSRRARQELETLYGN